MTLAYIRYSHVMDTKMVIVRSARIQDAEALAAIHDEAWRSTYQGIIPHVHLERMMARRGPAWWQRQLERGADLILLIFDGAPQGYASYGRARGPWPWAAGEIFELYLTPAFQGVGLGKPLFNAARAALKAEGLTKLVVWALEDNETACAFYSRRGGRISATATERYGETVLKRVAFVWA